MSVANSHDGTSNSVESFNAVLRRRVRVSHPNLLIDLFLKHLGEVSQDTVGDWDRLTRGCQIRRSKKTTALKDRLASTNLHRTCTLVTNFLFVVLHMRTIL